MSLPLQSLVVPGRHMRRNEVTRNRVDSERISAGLEWWDLLVASGSVGWNVEDILSELQRYEREGGSVSTGREVTAGEAVDNMRRTAASLTAFLRQIGAVRAGINCGLRLPEHNRAVSGSAKFSRHMIGAAVDLDDVVVLEKGEERVLAPWEISARAFFETSGELAFNRCFYYNYVNDGGYQVAFAHLGASVGGGSDAWTWSEGRHDTDRPRPDASTSKSKRFSEIEPPSGLNVTEGRGSPKLSGEAEAEGYDGPNPTNPNIFFGRAPEDVMRALNSGRGAGELQAKDWSSEAGKIVPISPPQEGEIDIGDFRFGSKFKGFSVSGEDLEGANQITSETRQASGQTMGVRLLRAEQAPPIAAKDEPTEVVATIAVNATERSDINRVLRPLMAMLRRHPVIACRSKELSRLMLGITGASDLAEEIEQAFPGLRSGEAERRAQEVISGGGTGSIWVPCCVRSVSARTAEGASGLFYVNVALQRAVVGPHVPSMTYWTDTASAVEWSRHQQARGQVGAEAIEILDDGGAVVETPDGQQIQAPVPDLSKQTSSPRESPVFRKFYRGLLEEDHQQDRGYPISIADRLWESYDDGAEMELTYSAPAPERGRGELLSGVVEALDQRRLMAEELDAAINLYNSGGELQEFKDLGRYNGIYVGIGQDLHTLMTGLSDAAGGLQRSLSRLQSVVQGRSNRPGRVSELIYEGGEVKSVEGQGTSITEAASAEDILRTPGLGFGNVSGFTVPDSESDLNVSIETIANRLQRSVLVSYAEQVKRLSERDGEAGDAFRKMLQVQMHTSARENLGEGEVPRGFVQFRSDWISSSGEVPEFGGTGFDALSEADKAKVKQAYKAALLSPEFLFPLAGRGPNPPDWIYVDGSGSDLIEECLNIKILIDHAEDLTKKIARSIQSIRGDLEGYAAGAQEGQIGGTMQLAATELKSINVSFSHHFNWQEWEAWSGPVPQHMGSSPMEVQMELSASDELVLDQIGEMEQAQQSLASIRQEGNAAPPLVDIGGRGNLLRALGIRHMTYRGHRESTSSDEAGWSSVSLRFGQDEDSLSSYERLWEASLQGNNLFTWELAEPLALPSVDAGIPTAPGLSTAVSALTLLEKVYGVGDSEWASGPTLDRGGVQDQQKYGPLLLRGDEAGWERVAERFADWGEPTRVTVEYDLNTSRARDFRCHVRFSEAGRVEVDLNPLLRRWGDFLAFAEGEMDRPDWISLVRFINGSLSTTTEGDGWVLTLLRLAFLRLSMSGQIDPHVAEQKVSVWGSLGQAAIGSVATLWRAIPGGVVDAAQAALGYEGQWEDYSEGVSSWREWTVEGTARYNQMFLDTDLPEDIADNLTRTAGLLNSDPTSLPGGISMAGRLFSREAKNIAARLSRGEAAGVYRKWLAGNEAAVSALGKAEQKISEIEGLMPSCQRDTLLSDVKDGQGRSLIGWDFPFGPGRESLESEKSLADYEFAEAKRREVQMKLATVGLETMLTDIAKPLEGSYEALTDRELDGSGHPKDASDTWKVGSTWYRWSGDEDTVQGQRYEAVYNAAIEDLSESSGEGVSLPQDFLTSMNEIRRRGGFRANPGQLRELTAEDWLRILQISRTVRYVTAISQVAAEDFEEGLSDVGEVVRGKIAQLKRQGTESRLESGRAMILSSFSKSVQDSEWLAKERQELIRLYNADASIVSEVLGWTDPSGERSRAELLRELRDKWKGPVGMRNVFPSYQIVILGNARQGGFELLEDAYSYTAARKIEMNSAAKQAGSYGFLELSNLRRVIGEPERGGGLTAAAFRGSPDTALQLKEGNHIQVAVGYGPDRSCLEPLTGRITGVEHGDISRIEVSSYATTTLNPPNKGAGLFTSGKDETYTLAAALFFSIAATQGLEGLGRHQIGGTDGLGRGPQGGADDDYRLGLAASLHRALGRPGLDALLNSEEEGESARVASQVFKQFEDLAADIGVETAKEYLIGGKRLYENIYAISGGDRSGMSDIFMGSIDELFEGGQGFSWSSMPGTPLWTIMQKMAKWRPGYVVGSRPYNRGVPLSDMAEHRPRETLYFGPKNGQYTSTSYESGQGSLERVSGEALGQMLSEEYSSAYSGGGERRALERLYEDVFWKGFLLPLVYRQAQEGSEPWMAGLDERTRNYFGQFLGGFNGRDLFSATDYASLLDTQLPAQVVRGVMNTVSEVWGEEFAESHEFYTEFRELGRFHDNGARTLGGLLNGFAPFDYRELFSPGLSADYYLNFNRLLKRKGSIDERIEAVSSSGRAEERERLTVYRDNFHGEVLPAFKRALTRVAASDGTVRDIAGEDLLRNPVLKSIRDRLEAKGYRLGETTQPFRRHHFASSLDSLCSAEVEAASTNQGFANTINLEWPANGSDPLAALNPEADTNTWTVSAAPTLLPEAVVQASVYAANLNSDLNSSASSFKDLLRIAQNSAQNSERDYDLGTLSDSRARLAGSSQKQVSFNEKTGEIDFSERTGEGWVYEHRAAVMQKVENQVTEVIDNMKSIDGLQPKYQDVGVSLLADSLRYMYSGSLLMPGSPHVRPYDIVHVYAPEKKLFGPVEVEEVSTVFGVDSGFKTSVKPALVTEHRGVDATMDTAWIYQAGRYQSWVGSWSRFGRGLWTTLGTSTNYAAVGSAAGWAAGTFTSIASSAATFSRGGVIGAGIGATVGIIDALQDAGADKSKAFVGMMSQITGANPVMFHPLNQYGEPLVAGLTGAIGPSSLRSAEISGLNQSSSAGEWSEGFFGLMQRLDKGNNTWGT